MSARAFVQRLTIDPRKIVQGRGPSRKGMLVVHLREF
jgi:hypothetical protein